MEKKFSQLVAKAWSDPVFKARLLANPAAVFAEEGIAIPEGVTIQVYENTDTEQHFVLPKKTNKDEPDYDDPVIVCGSNA